MKRKWIRRFSIAIAILIFTFGGLWAALWLCAQPGSRIAARDLYFSTVSLIDQGAYERAVGNRWNAVWAFYRARQNLRALVDRFPMWSPDELGMRPASESDIQAMGNKIWDLILRKAH